MIRNFLFDLGGVIIDLDVQRSLDAFSKIVNPHLSSEGMVTAQGLMGGRDGGLIDQYQVGAISTRQFIDGILSVCRPNTTDQQVIDAWYAMLIGIREDRRQLLRDLKRANYGIYILSNINDLHVTWTIEHCPELQIANHLFFSNLIKLAKPDARCYDLVLQETGINPAETLYVDDLDANLLAGQKVGFQTIDAKSPDWINQIRTLTNLQ